MTNFSRSLLNHWQLENGHWRWALQLSSPALLFLHTLALSVWMQWPARLLLPPPTRPVCCHVFPYDKFYPLALWAVISPFLPYIALFRTSYHNDKRMRHSVSGDWQKWATTVPRGPFLMERAFLINGQERSLMTRWARPPKLPEPGRFVLWLWLRAGVFRLSFLLFLRQILFPSRMCWTWLWWFHISLDCLFTSFIWGVDFSQYKSIPSSNLCSAIWDFNVFPYVPSFPFKYLSVGSHQNPGETTRQRPEIQLSHAWGPGSHPNIPYNRAGWPTCEVPAPRR